MKARPSARPAHVNDDPYGAAKEWLARQRSPLSTSRLATIVGLSISFIRTEIRLGEIKAIRVGRGQKPTYRIPFPEAVRYVRRLGLPSSSTPGCQTESMEMLRTAPLATMSQRRT